jgi:lipopolysaccharide/colanic/teichoic acid biosynthesis glycosyltransferase
MRIAKRVFDVLAGSILALLAVPFIAVSAAASGICLRCWPFFAQERVGRNGRSFRIVKVRTLPSKVPCYTDKNSLDPACLSRPMAFLRRTHFDELPQLFLVVAGKMSLVGPRPEMRFLHDRLPPATAKLRTSLRPGCTGLWQISESSVALINEAPEYDQYYVLQQSFRFDLWILWRTFRVMFTRAQSVGIEDIPRWALPTTTLDTELDLTPSRTLPAAMREVV